MPDEDGYLLEEELEPIKTWNYKDFHGWMRYIQSVWWASESLFNVDNDIYYVSTGGWSGNEEVIHTMKQNFILWNIGWKSTERGGHYVFKLRDLK